MGVNWNSLVAPLRLSGELSSCADNGYLLQGFIQDFLLGGGHDALML